MKNLKYIKGIDDLLKKFRKITSSIAYSVNLCLKLYLSIAKPIIFYAIIYPKKQKYTKFFYISYFIYKGFI